MLALAQYEDGLCPSCRRPIRECTDPDADWRVPAPTRCFVTTALSAAQKPYLESDHPEALLFHVERKR